MNKQSAISDQQSAVPQSDEPTTEDVYRPVATLDAEHRHAFTELQAAVVRGDEKAMKQAFDKITYIEGMQQLAHEAARNHALGKVKR